MRKQHYISLFAICLLSFICANSTFGDEKNINMHYPGHQDPRREYYQPVDMPEIYYDDVTETIIVDGGGEVDYYDVVIASASTFTTFITTQVSGTYDTINVSSLPQSDYVIIIYSPTGNEFECFFDTY